MLQKFVWRQCYLQKVNRPQCPFTLKDSEIYIKIKNKKCNQALHAKFHFRFFFSFYFYVFPLGIIYLSIYICIHLISTTFFTLLSFFLLFVFSNNGFIWHSFQSLLFCHQIIQMMILYKEFQFIILLFLKNIISFSLIFTL